MSTLKQIETAEKTLENIGIKPPKTKGKILADVGYSEGIQKNPKEVYDTDGYKKAEAELLKEKKIDFNSRLTRLADIFHDKDKRAVLGANKEITSMLGEYKQQDIKAVALFDRLEEDLAEEDKIGEEKKDTNKNNIDIEVDNIGKSSKDI